MFSKVIISGDILRPFLTGSFYQSATKKNIHWLKALLKNSLLKCNMDVSALSWDEDLSGNDLFFDTPDLYQKLGIPLNREGWARLASSDVVPDELLESLREPLNQALVIGYELPKVITHALTMLGTPFIDVVLHPMRFLPDLLFSFRTNVAEFHQKFKNHVFDSSYIEQQVSLLQAKNAWMSKPAGLTIPAGSAIILEQVSDDMAVVQNNGRFARLEDHIPRLHQIISEHPAVFIKPHPYTLDKKSISRITSAFPVTQLCNTNFYHLMMQPEIEKVIALNSSGLIEAVAFGKEAENLIPFKFCHAEDFLPEKGEPGSLIPLNDSWLQPQFWRELFDGENRAVVMTRQAIWQPNRLRHAMNADWGYQLISNTVV